MRSESNKNNNNNTEPENPSEEITTPESGNAEISQSTKTYLPKDESVHKWGNTKSRKRTDI